MNLVKRNSNSRARQSAQKKRDINRIIKKYRKYEKIIKVLDRSPAMYEAINRLAERAGDYRRTYILNLIRDITRILKKRRKAFAFFGLAKI